MTTYTLTELYDKRNELAGLIIQAEKRARELREELGHIDAAIKILRPGTDLPKIVPKRVEYRPRYFKRGQLTRLCLDHLRAHTGEAVTVSDILPLGLILIFLPIFHIVNHRSQKTPQLILQSEEQEDGFDLLNDLATSAKLTVAYDPDTGIEYIRLQVVLTSGLQLSIPLTKEARAVLEESCGYLPPTSPRIQGGPIQSE